MVEKSRRGRWPKFVDIRATPFNDLGKLAGSVRELRTSVSDLWVGYTKRGIQEYRRARERKPIRDRTFTEWAKEWHEAPTQNGKPFYFRDPLPDDIRKRIGQVRVGGRQTEDMVLFAVRDPAGRTAAWLARPRV